MNREEIKKLVRVVVATYPNFRPVDISDTIDAWEKVFEGMSYDDVSVALAAYNATNRTGFAPSPGQIIGMLQDLVNRNEDTEAEAWSMVRKAIENSGYHAEEEFSKLPPLVQKAVGSPNELRSWALDPEFNDSVIRSHFLRIYGQVRERESKMDRLPPTIKALLKTTEQKAIGAAAGQNQNALQDKTRRETPSEARQGFYERDGYTFIDLDAYYGHGENNEPTEGDE